MELDRKEVDKVLSLKRTFDIITDRRLCIDYDLISHDVKLKINIRSYKNSYHDLIIVSNITIQYDSKNHGFSIKLNTDRGSFLINITSATLSTPVGIFYDEDVVLDKMNSFTYKRFDDINKAVVDLMMSYIE